MDIKYVVSVTQVVDSAPVGSEPKITKTVLADFTGGSSATAAVLSSLAETVQKSKKVVGLAALLQTVNAELEKHSKKAREEGKPTLAETLGDLFDSKKNAN